MTFVYTYSGRSLLIVRRLVNISGQSEVSNFYSKMSSNQHVSCREISVNTLQSGGNTFCVRSAVLDGLLHVDVFVRSCVLVV